VPLPRDEGLERFRPEPAERLAAAPPRLDETGRAKPPDVPAHERLRQADVLDEVAHGRMPVGQPLDDPEPVDVRECLVDDAKLPQVVRLVDDAGESRADPRARRAQDASGASMAIYINGR
jgi:hypothetical protein